MFSSWSSTKAKTKANTDKDIKSSFNFTYCSSLIVEHQHMFCTWCSEKTKTKPKTDKDKNHLLVISSSTLWLSSTNISFALGFRRLIFICGRWNALLLKSAPDFEVDFFFAIFSNCLSKSLSLCVPEIEKMIAKWASKSQTSQMNWEICSWSQFEQHQY